MFGEKDTAECRRDLEEVGQRRRLWLRPRPNNSRFHKPPIPYVLTNAERLFVDEVSLVCTPSGYGSALAKHYKKAKFFGLKSHDYHCLLQQLILVAVRILMQPLERTALIRLGKCLKRICARVVDIAELDKLRLYIVETICMLEVCIPPSFFDIMEHLLIHLVDELEVCGRVGGRWMYPRERYLGTLKSYVRSKAQPEASMANGYAAEEALGFCTKYLNLQTYTKRHVWENEEEQGMMGALVQGRGRLFRPTPVMLGMAHNYIIMHDQWTLDMRSILM